MPSPTCLWEAPADTVAAGDNPGDLPGPWRLMLLGDGSPTRHLRLLTGHPVSVELVAMAEEPKGQAALGCPSEVQELTPPLLCRQVWLSCGEQTLA